MRLFFTLTLFFLSPMSLAQFSPKTLTEPSVENYKYPHIKQSVFLLNNSIKDSIGTSFYIGNNQFVTNTHNLLNLDDMIGLNEFFNLFLGEEILSDKPISLEDVLQIFRQEDFFETQNISEILSIKYKNQLIPFNKIVAIDFKHDLMILEVDSQYSKWLEEFIPLEIGVFSEKLTNKSGHLYGFPEDKPVPFELHEFKEMNFENIVFYDNNHFSSITNVNHLSGASGSPLLINNKVIGVLKSAIHNTTLSTSSNILNEMLDRKPISLTTDTEVIAVFFYFIKQIKSAPESDWMSLLFLYEIEEPYSLEEVRERINKLKKLLHDNQNISSLNLMILYHLQIYKYEYGYGNKYDQFINLSKNSNDPYILYLLAIFQLEQDRLEEALINLKNSATLGCAPALFILAIYHFVKGDLELYEKYITESSDRGHLLAQLHFNKNQLATNSFGESTKIQPYDLSLIIRNNENYIPSDYYIGMFNHLLKKRETL